MKRIKIITSIILILLFFNSLLQVIPIISANYTNFENTEEVCESYLIEGVPYVGQDEIHYCEYGAVEMVFRYYGINITQDELLYGAGGGYSYGYRPTLKAIMTPPRIKIPFKLKIWCDELTAGTEDYELVAEHNGLTFEYIYPDRVVNHEKCWQEYWALVKEYIKQDIPIVTGVDATAWPPYLERINRTFIVPKLFAGTHIVTLIGFNESNQTVCVNDPGCGLFNQAASGTYRWVDLKFLKLAVSRIFWEIKEDRYQLLVFKKAGEPIDKNLSAEIIHKRNIEKLKGNKSAYDSDFQRANFQLFGIDAVKQLRNDFNTKFIIRVPMFKQLYRWNIFYPAKDPLKKIVRTLYYESVTKKNIANYLKENSQYCEYNMHDGFLLENESALWAEANSYGKEIIEIINTRTIPGAILRCRPLVKEIVRVLDEIIEIQNEIIQYSS